MTPLTTLIERIEKAEGPDWSIDRAIFEALCLPDKMFGSKVESWFSDGFAAYGCNTADGIRHLNAINAPNFTASIDAALTLLPEDYDWIVAGTNGGLTVHACCGSTKEYFGDTPALALLSAILRAIQAQREAGEKRGEDEPQ